jgi:hypothetical protein
MKCRITLSFQLQRRLRRHEGSVKDCNLRPHTRFWVCGGGDHFLGENISTVKKITEALSGASKKVKAEKIV